MDHGGRSMTDDDLDPDAPEAGVAAVLAEGVKPGESVLDALERKSGRRPRIRLKDITGLGEADAGPRTHSHYIFQGEIGRGGVGVVLKGTDVDLGREVALKILHEEYSAHPQAVARFVEEAQIEGQLQHPGIVPVYELGVGYDGRPFFAMKLVKGKTLTEHLEQRESPVADRRRYLSIFEQIALAMAYAHARGVIHRDLKPSNVMVGSFGEVQVVDWGLAKVLGRDEETIKTVRTESDCAESRVGMVMGTPSYMPPEQALGKMGAIDERADVFALGAILLEVLTGEPPYPKDAPDVLIRAAKGKLEESFARLEECEADGELKALCRECLSLDPEGRPADARAVEDRVGAHLAGVEERARQAELAAAEARVKAIEERKARRLTVALAAAVLLAVLVGGGGWRYVAGERQKREKEAGRAVATALGEARERWGEARKAEVGNLAPWTAAKDAAVRAVEVAETGGAAPTIVEESRGLLSEIEADLGDAAQAAARRARDGEMVDRLEEIRARRGSRFRFLAVEEDYRNAFRDYGVDPDGEDPGEAAERIRESAIAADLCAALDDWALVRTRYSSGEAAKAVRLHEIANAADPDEWHVRVRAAADAMDSTALKALAEEADLGGKSPAALMFLATALAAAESPRAGIEILRDAQLRNPSDFWINHQLGYWLANLASPKLGESEAFYRSALAVRPADRDTRLNLGYVLRTLKRDSEALHLFEEIVASHPEDYGAALQVYLVLRDRGELPARIPVLEENLKRRPEDPLSFWRLATAHRLLWQVDEAIEIFRRGLEAHPTSLPLHKGLGFVYYYPPYKRVDPDLAEKHLSAAARLDPRDALVWQWLGSLRTTWERYQAGVEAWGQAVRAAPDIIRYHVLLTRNSVRADDPDRALDAYRELLRRFPEHPSLGDLEYLLAWDLRAKRCREGVAKRIALRAIDRLSRQLREEKPDNAYSYQACIATLYCDVLDDPREAIRWFKLAVESQPEQWSLRQNIGLAYSQLGDIEQSVAWFENVAEHATGRKAWRGQLYNFYGWAVQCAGDQKRATELWRKGAEYNPKNEWLHLQLGYDHIEQGRLEEARRSFDRYQELACGPAERKVPAEAWSRWRDGLIEAARHLPAVERGEDPEMEPRARLRLGAILYHVGIHDICFASLERAFREDPSLLSEIGPYHYPMLMVGVAARAAGCMAIGWGCPAQSPTAEERETWRRRAREWTARTLDQWEKHPVERTELNVPSVAIALMEFERTGEMAAIRVDTFLEKLPEEERAECRALWARLDRMQQVLEEAK